MTSAFEIDRAEYMAFNEAILRSTVGIAVNNNARIGTGTLVSFGGKNFVFTAEHVIADANLPDLRYFIPPSTPLIEHSMLKGLPSGFEMAYAGDCFKVGDNPIIDKGNDLAAIPLVDSPLMPAYMRFFPVDNFAEAMSDGSSLLVVGFPVDNSARLDEPDQYSSKRRAIGLTSEHALYCRALQTKFVLHSSYDWNRHFLIEYSRVQDGITPPGFSGAAAWCSGSSGSSIWAAHPIFAGMLTRWFRKTATYPDLLQGTQGAFVKEWFRQNC